MYNAHANRLDTTEKPLLNHCFDRPGSGSDPVRVCDHCYKHEHLRAACMKQHLPFLMQGGTLVKHPGTTGFGQPHPRVIRLDSDQKTLRWHKQGSQPKSDSRMLVTEISDIIVGLGTSAIRRTAPPEKNSLCFSIVDGSRSLDLECNSQEQRDAWVQALRTYVQFAKLETPEVKRLKSERAMERAQQAEAAAKQRAERAAHRQALRAKYGLRDST